MTNPFRLGFLTHIEGAGDPAPIYQETLELFVVADQLGFDVAWVAEHHFKEWKGRLPSLFPFLAAAAERTRHLRLGTSVVVLPFASPLRVAEDAAVVDTLSGGRLELGVGSGSDPNEFQAFDLDIGERHQRTTEGIALLQHALRGDPLGHDDLRLQPPAPTLVERLWQSALSEVGAGYVARNGAGLMLSRAAWKEDKPTDAVQLPVANAYREAWDGYPGGPRIGLSRGIYPAADRAHALARLHEDVLRDAENRVRQGNFPPGGTLEEYCQRLHIAYGHPEEVAATLAADRVLPHSTDLILQFSPAIPPLDEAIWMLEQIAGQIAPALGWQPQGGRNARRVA